MPYLVVIIYMAITVAILSFFRLYVALKITSFLIGMYAFFSFLGFGPILLWAIIEGEPLSLISLLAFNIVAPVAVVYFIPLIVGAIRRRLSRLSR